MLEQIRVKWLSKNNNTEAAMAMWDSQAEAPCSLLLKIRLFTVHITKRENCN